MCTTMSTKSSNVHRPSRAPSRRAGLYPARRIFSSTSSTIALTWRSLDADAMTKQSVMTSWPDTSMMTTSAASLDAAARATTVAILMASSVAVISDALRACVLSISDALRASGSSISDALRASGSSISDALRASGSSPVPVFRHARLGGVELAFGHVLHDAIGHQVPDRPVLSGTLAAVGRRDRKRGHLDEGQRVSRQLSERRRDVLAVEVVAGAADADEPGDREHFLPVLPRQDRGKCVRAGDEVEVRVGVERAQIAQRVLGIGRAAAVDVHPAEREPGVGRRGDDRHQVAILGSGDVAMVLLPGLAGRDVHHFVELEQIGNLAGRDQVAVVDGVERPTHHPHPPSRSHKQPAYGSANAHSDRRESVGPEEFGTLERRAISAVDVAGVIHTSPSGVL